jgi:peptidoglycan/xylan/chitin deacetylase (PgdA/CDA1 family)
MTTPATPSNATRQDVTRRAFLGAATAGTLGTVAALSTGQDQSQKKAQIAITFDLEMSRHYPKRGMTEWDYQKGNLDEPTKQYSVNAARIAKERGGLIHFFCVGRVLEHSSVDWLKTISEAGHPIGNHTYDHVNVLATAPEATQFRFKRAPWLVADRTAAEVIAENIRTTTIAMQQRAGITANGFRTPGGFHRGLNNRPDVQQLLLDADFTWASCKYPRHISGEPMQEPGPEVYADIVRAQADAQPFVYPSGLIEIPMSPISDVGAFRTKFWKLEYFLKAVRLAIEWTIETRSVFDFLCHPSCMVVEDPEFKTVKLICDLVNAAGDKAEIVGLDEIARNVTA